MAAQIDNDTHEHIDAEFDMNDDGEIYDRCCCECGNHFDGSLEDDYCCDCYDKLNPCVNLSRSVNR